MPSEKFRITTNGQSLRNPNNAFFGNTQIPKVIKVSVLMHNNDNNRNDTFSQYDTRREVHIHCKLPYVHKLI